MELEQEVEPLIGTRLFKVSEGYHLVGLGPRTLVWDGHTLQAECLKDASPVEGVDLIAQCDTHLREGSCQCGIYLVMLDKRLQHDYWQRIAVNHYVEVEAVCKAWGICIEGTTGMRCQFATITSLDVLFKPCSVCTLYTAEYYDMKSSGTNNAWCPLCVPSEMKVQANQWETILEQLEQTYKVPVTFKPLQIVYMYDGNNIRIDFPMAPELQPFLKDRLTANIQKEEDRKMAILKEIKERHENGTKTT